MSCNAQWDLVNYYYQGNHHRRAREEKNWAKQTLLYKESKFLKKLWCCVGGRVWQVI